jgi:hypothetical protein
MYDHHIKKIEKKKTNQKKKTIVLCVCMAVKMMRKCPNGWSWWRLGKYPFLEQPWISGSLVVFFFRPISDMKL